MEPHLYFKACRVESGLSQNRLSLEAGYDHSYVSRIESDSRTPTREALSRFIDAMELEEETADQLMDAYGYTTDRHILASPMELQIHNRIQNEEGFEIALRSVIGGFDE